MKPFSAIITNIYIERSYAANKLPGYRIRPTPRRLRTMASYPFRIGWLIWLVIAPAPARIATAQDSAHGTAIAAIIRPGEIVVAADSRAVDGNNRPDPEPICKIRQSGSVFYVVHGFVENKPTRYDFFSTADTSLNAKGTTLSKIVTFEQTVKSQLEATLQNIKHNNPTRFEEMRVDGAAVGILFFGIQRQKELFFYYRRFLISNLRENAVEVDVERHNCPGKDCPFGIALVFAPKEDLEQFQRENPSFWNGNLIDATRKFVQKEIDKGLVHIGPPIDILRITKRGADWIQHKPECPDIQPYWQAKPLPKPANPGGKKGRPKDFVE
ncbi:MAG TPA: hypothetical protein VJ464_01335 [Blastocatellia bacterium]|nr:hypothetical protein [Blastocatellia bacterium]